MATHAQQDTSDRFNRSNFLSSEIPPVVFAATQYSRLRDAAINGPRLVSEATRLLTLLEDEFRHPSRDLPDYLMTICLGQKAVEAGSLTQYSNTAPDLIYAAAKERCQSSRAPFSYATDQLSRPDRKEQQRLFRDDVAAHLSGTRGRLEGVSGLDANLLEAIDSLAMFLIEFTAKSVNREQEKVKPAALYAHLIQAAQINPAATIQFSLEHFTTLLDEKLRKSAPDLLARQLSPTLSRAVAEAATSQSSVAETQSSQERRLALVNDLQRGLRNDELLLRFLMRPFVIEDAVSTKELNRALLRNTPEWLQTLFVNGRLTRPDLDSFLRVSERMKEELGSATTVSIDLGLFSWPRITEIAALTRAKDLLIHSDLPFSSPSSPEGSPISPEAIRALARREPNILPYMALAGSAEVVILEEKKVASTARGWRH